MCWSALSSYCNAVVQVFRAGEVWLVMYCWANEYVPRQRSRYSDSLRAGRSGDQILVGARFSAPDQTGPGAHPASFTMGTGSFPRVKRPERGIDHPPTSSAEVEERVELYLSFPSGPSWPVLG